MNNKRKPIPELDNLPEPKREQLHEWIDTLGYIKTIAKLKAEWDFTITYNKLRRYWMRWLEKVDYDQALEDELTIPQYLDLLNGRALPYDKAGIQRIMMRAYHRIGETGQSVTKLATLLRILHYNTNCEWTNKRIAISHRIATVREQELDLKKSRSFGGTGPSPASHQQADHLGPLATTLDDIEARATRKFNLRPRTEAEKRAAAAARRLDESSSVSATPNLQSHPAPTPEPDSVSPLINTGIHAGGPLSAGPQSVSTLSPSLPESESSAPVALKLDDAGRSAVVPSPSREASIPESLEERVNKYNLARYHEARHGKDPTKVGRSAAYNFRSALQTCPCGKHLPCTDHGDFPRRFFELFPDDFDYFYCLQKKKLPYTPIHQLLAREAERSDAQRQAPDLNLSSVASAKEVAQ